ncbi:RadC family protein [Pseudomonas lopnurensis]|uniref:RadC family protein n=1 Tax=Pseudomonas lopnurensis TaxID=1477517 RepID=UPI0028B15012|nr:DNA repair protein RadC [Pseudomonas lopnurensis]
MSAQLSLIESHEVAQEDLVIEEAMRILDRRLFHRGPELIKPESVARYLKLKLARLEHEAFSVVFLDSKHRPLAFEILFHGTVDSAVVYPRQVVKRALAHNASAIILAHNHPSGCCDPSSADRTLTQRLKDALAFVDVRVLDHFIIGAGEPQSMAELGQV